MCRIVFLIRRVLELTNRAGSEKLQSGCLVALCALQLLTYIEKPATCTRMCCGELRRDAIRSEVAVGKETHHVL